MGILQKTKAYWLTHKKLVKDFFRKVRKTLVEILQKVKAFLNFSIRAIKIIGPILCILGFWLNHGELIISFLRNLGATLLGII